MFASIAHAAEKAESMSKVSQITWSDQPLFLDSAIVVRAGFVGRLLYMQFVLDVVMNLQNLLEA